MDQVGPVVTTASSTQAESDRRWRRQLAVAEAQATELTPEEMAAKQQQARNPGPLVPFFRDRQEQRAKAELAHRQRALHDDPRAIRPADRLHPSDNSYVKLMGQHSRAMNPPRDPHEHLYRAGPHNDDESAPEAEMIDSPWRRGRL
jgi:hypothetical protein